MQGRSSPEPPNKACISPTMKSMHYSLHLVVGVIFLQGTYPPKMHPLAMVPHCADLLLRILWGEEIGLKHNLGLLIVLT